MKSVFWDSVTNRQDFEVCLGLVIAYRCFHLSINIFGVCFFCAIMTLRSLWVINHEGILFSFGYQQGEAKQQMDDTFFNTGTPLGLLYHSYNRIIRHMRGNLSVRFRKTYHKNVSVFWWFFLFRDLAKKQIGKRLIQICRV